MSSDIDKAVANLEDKDWRVRYAAVRALGKSPEAVAQHGAAIAQRLEHKDARVRKAAVTRRRKIYIRLRHFRVAIRYIAVGIHVDEDDDTVMSRSLEAHVALPSPSHPPSPSPAPPPYAPSAVHIVLNTSRCIVRMADIDISFAHNHRCEDGGEGSVSSICRLGYDFPDCPARRIIVPRFVRHTNSACRNRYDRLFRRKKRIALARPY